MNPALSLVTAPAATPWDLTEAKLHLRIDGSAEDSLLTAYLNAATEQVEMFTRRSLINRTYSLRLDRFPSTTFVELPRPPLASVTHVKYRDEAGVEQTLSSGNYSVLTDELVGMVVLKADQAWPATAERVDAVEIRFVAGYGSGAANVPQSLRLAVLHLAAHWFENRVPVNIGNIVNKLPLHVESLLWAHRVMTF